MFVNKMLRIQETARSFLISQLLLYFAQLESEEVIISEFSITSCLNVRSRDRFDG